MSLSSPSFLLFALVSVPVYYALPAKLRNGFLLAAGAVFYCFGVPVYLPLVAATSLFGYFMAFALEKRGPEGGGALTFLSVAVPVGLLCAFKYLSAPLGALLSGVPLFSSVVAENAQGALSLIMPLGISFYTFTLVGYLLDVRHGKIKAERSVVDFLAFVTFFPCILSGPINRAGELLPQFKEKHEWSYGGTVYGLQRFLTGAFKKLVLADGLSLIVNGAWGDIEQYRGLTLWVAAIGYTVQLYCDFSGYTDMAVGAAALFGFKPRENFDAPFSATNMSGFWSRWHMSLTGWFNDYVFTPLVWSRWANRLFFGRRWQEHKPHFALNIIIVFLLSGAWHGSTVTYVLWGLANGLLRVGEELLHRIKPLNKRKKQPLPVVWLKRAGVFVMFSATLILFRAPSLAECAEFVSSMLEPTSLGTVVNHIFYLVSSDLADSGTFYLIYFGTMLFAFICLVGFDVSLLRAERTRLACPQNALGRIKNPSVRMLLYWAMGISVMMFYFISYTKLDGGVSFIYAGF